MREWRGDEGVWAAADTARCRPPPAPVSPIPLPHPVVASAAPSLRRRRRRRLFRVPESATHTPAVDLQHQRQDYTGFQQLNGGN